MCNKVRYGVLDCRRTNFVHNSVASGKVNNMTLSLVESQSVTSVSIEGDVLQDMVHEIENLKEKVAYQLIDNLIEQTGVTYFKLGGVLSVCVFNQWFQGYPSFKEMLEGKYGFAYRKGMSLIEIYNKLANSGIPWSKFCPDGKPLGWVKVQVIAPVVTQENVDNWVKIATEQNTLTLIETVKNSKKGTLSLEDKTVKAVTNMKFVLHSDQKATIEAALAKAKQQSSTDVASVALEFICLDYMGGSTLKDRVKAAGPVALGKIIAELYDDAKVFAPVLKYIDVGISLNAIGENNPNLDITVSLAEDGTCEEAA